MPLDEELLVRIEQRLHEQTQAIGELKTTVAVLASKFEPVEGLEGRVDKLEQSRAKTKGWVAGVSALGGGGIAALLNQLMGK